MAGHVGPSHWRRKTHFDKYAQLVNSEAAPMLAALDAVRMRLEQADEQQQHHQRHGSVDGEGGAELDEQSASRRFTATVSVARAHDDLSGALDHVEASHKWDSLDGVHNLIEHAQRALTLAEAARCGEDEEWREARGHEWGMK